MEKLFAYGNLKKKIFKKLFLEDYYKEFRNFWSDMVKEIKSKKNMDRVFP
jgi:hypothetical protein